MDKPPLRIAMWSGPRNISTAMMRSFEARGDAFVSDEPFYGYYLSKTGLMHPGREEIINSTETDWQKIVDEITAPLPDNYNIWYQKHMAHHMIHYMNMEWLSRLENCFLIREPAEVILSYIKKNDTVTLEDTGFPQIVKIFELVSGLSGITPPVIDARDLLVNPQKTLTLLCNKIGIKFTDKMLKWGKGIRSTDGIWAEHWYDSVANSTGFGEYKPKSEKLDPKYDKILNECNEYYSYLYNVRLHA